MLGCRKEYVKEDDERPLKNKYEVLQDKLIEGTEVVNLEKKRKKMKERLEHWNAYARLSSEDGRSETHSNSGSAGHGRGGSFGARIPDSDAASPVGGGDTDVRGKALFPITAPLFRPLVSRARNVILRATARRTHGFIAASSRGRGSAY